jgi:hypothetical protein
MATVAAIALGAIAIVAFVVMRPEPSTSRRDLSAHDASTPVAMAPSNPIDAATVIAEPPTADAAPAPAESTRDAIPVADPVADAGSRAPHSPGTLTVGAIPRGDVYVDGKLIGEAPGRWTVAAGRHRVEVRYKSKRRRFAVTVAPSGAAELFADFAQQ